MVIKRPHRKQQLSLLKRKLLVRDAEHLLSLRALVVQQQSPSQPHKRQVMHRKSRQNLVRANLGQPSQKRQKLKKMVLMAVQRL